MKYIFRGLAIIIISYLVFFVTIHLIYTHSFNITGCKENRRFFKAEIIDQINPICSCFEGKHDTYSHYIYKKNYYIDIWEFKNLSHINPKKVPFYLGKDLSNVRSWAGEVLNSKETKQTQINYGFDFEQGMQIDLDRNGTIIRKIEAHNYNGFYGTLNKISLSDDKGEPQLVLEYVKTNEPVVFLLYKRNSSLFVITIDSEVEPFDESILNILNL